MELLHIAGWSITAILTLLLIVQLRNDQTILPLDRKSEAPADDVSVLIPARNEEENIDACVRSLAQQSAPPREILVLDDGSTDRTAGMVRAIAAVYPHVRLLAGDPLPEGWTGKNWACHQLSQHASGEWILFVDADTTHAPHMLGAAMARARELELDLLSLIPRELTGSTGEALALPMLRFSLFTLFPAFLLASTSSPQISAANGQFLLFRRTAYDAIGGHESVRGSIVDDLALGRRIREERLRLGLADGVGSVDCRMYRGASGVIEGFSKNLFAALGHSLPVAASSSAFLLALFVLPPVMLIATRHFPWLLATLLGLWLRLRTDVRGGHAPGWALLHPVSILLGIAVLGRSIIRWYTRRPVYWKGRAWGRDSN